MGTLLSVREKMLSYYGNKVRLLSPIFYAGDNSLGSFTASIFSSLLGSGSFFFLTIEKIF
jgi:hypothetical protein